MKLKIGAFGRFPPEDSPIATYLKNLVGSLGGKCQVVTIGLGDSDCNYRMSMNENFVKDINDIVKKEKLGILHIQYIGSSKHFAQNSKFSIINYFNTILSNIRLLRAMNKINIPKVVTLHELNVKSKNIKQLIVRWFEKKVMEKSDKVIVHSLHQKEILLNKKINVVFVHFGLTPMDVERKGGKNLLYLGTIQSLRGIEYLIRAMKLLPEYKLIIKGKVADRSYASMLKKEIVKNDLENVSIEFGWGTQKERDSLYRCADIVVLPYLWAPNQSAALHDAFSYRIPVVVTDTNGPIDETVREFGCGVVVGMKDSQKLADGIKRVYQNYQEYVNAIDNYRKTSNWDSVANKHIEVYREVAKMGA